jgi:hypothetical protein
MTEIDDGIYGDERLRTAVNTLAAFESRESSIDGALRKSLNELKVRAVSERDELMAKAVWCLEQIADVQDRFVRAFHEMKAGRYYRGWCLLEQAEIGLHHLGRHFADPTDLFGLRFIAESVPAMQALFPYCYFLSPGFIREEAECGICRAPIRPRSPCGHEVGEIYEGRMCTRITTKATMLEVSLVTAPVQKYSVTFTKGVKYNYAKIDYLIRALPSPWARWEVERQTRQKPRGDFNDLALDEHCPCGSRRLFQDCCSEEETVEIPHWQFIFGFNWAESDEHELRRVIHASEEELPQPEKELPT